MVYIQSVKMIPCVRQKLHEFQKSFQNGLFQSFLGKVAFEYASFFIDKIHMEVIESTFSSKSYHSFALIFSTKTLDLAIKKSGITFRTS